MFGKFIIRALVLIWVVTLFALIWMSEFAQDISTTPQVAAVIILIVVGYLLWKIAKSLPSPPRDDALGLVDFPEKLDAVLPAVLIRKLAPETKGHPPSHSPQALSWIGGQPPEFTQDWPVDPITGEKMQHYITLSFSQLGRHVAPNCLPVSGQLSFFICKKDALVARAKGLQSRDFAIIEIEKEQAAKQSDHESGLPFAPIDFVSGASLVSDRQTGTPCHQIFGEGLDIQAQLEPVQDRQLLLQLGYDDDIDVAGVIQFMIYPEDLKSRNWQATVAVVASD